MSVHRLVMASSAAVLVARLGTAGLNPNVDLILLNYLTID